MLDPRMPRVRVDPHHATAITERRNGGKKGISYVEDIAVDSLEEGNPEEDSILEAESLEDGIRRMLVVEVEGDNILAAEGDNTRLCPSRGQSDLHKIAIRYI